MNFLLNNNFSSNRFGSTSELQQTPGSDTSPLQSKQVIPQKTLLFRQFPFNRVPPSIPPPPPKTVVETPKGEPTMTWGKPTWFLFHTLAEKVVESQFLEIRAGLLNTVYSICINLPCPNCAEHAKAHLNGINFNTIRTKEDFKMLFFDFHNYVNSRKNYPIFRYEDLTKYETAITKNIIYNFLLEYNKKTKNIRYLADDLHREKISSSLRKWFFDNARYFAD